MNTSNISGKLKTGDFVVISTNNSLIPAFYLGNGQGCSTQFYTMNMLSLWLKEKRRWSTGKGLPYKYYINTDYNGRICKLSSDCLDENNLIEYNNAIEALKILKIIV